MAASLLLPLPRRSRWLGWRWAALATSLSQDGPDVHRELVELARRGDHHAFAEIVHVYDRRLRALAFRLLGDRDRMDDVLQEAYVKAFRALNGFKGESSLGTWLYRITYNACMDELRRGRPVVPLFGGDRGGDSEQASLAAGPAEIAVERGDLSAALSALPPDQRAAVLLVDAYGLDYDEAAQVLGVRPGTVGSRLTRARTALRAAMRAGAV